MERVMKHRLIGFAAAAVFMGWGASHVVAQGDPVLDDGVPRVWCWNEPLNADARFQDIIRASLPYVVSSGTSYDPEDAADWVADRLIASFSSGPTNRQKTDGRIAVMIQNYDHGYKDRTTTDPNYLRMLYNPADAIRDSNGDPRTVPTSSPTGLEVRYLRNFWMAQGRADSQAWAEAFAAQLSDRLFNAGLAAPNRLIMDEEPNFGMSLAGESGDDAIDNDVKWWRLVQTDDRYDTQLPGFPSGTTLKSLWTTSGLAEPILTEDFNQDPGDDGDDSYWDLVGGCRINHDWYEWVENVWLQCMSSALFDTLGYEVKDAFPLCKYSEYGRSTDVGGDRDFGAYGSASGRDPEPRTIISGGFSGRTGFSYHFSGSGDFQSPVIYPTFTDYFINNSGAFTNMGLDGYFAPATTPQSTKPFDRAEAVLRHNLDSCVTSTSLKPVQPWICLPYENLAIGAGSATVPPEDRFYRYYSYRQTASDTRKLLALLRTRGVTEFNVWNTERSYLRLKPSGGSADNYRAQRDLVDDAVPPQVVFAMDDLPHPQRACNWELLSDLVDEVYSFSIVSNSDVSVSGTTAFPGPTDRHTRLAYAMDYPLTFGAIGSGGTYTSSVAAKFTHAGGSFPSYGALVLTAEVRADTDADVGVEGFIATSYSGSTPTYTSLGSATTYNLKNKKFLRWVIPSGSYATSGATTHAKISFVRTGASITVSVDQLHLHGSNNEARPLGDLNADAVVDEKDYQLFWLLQDTGELSKMFAQGGHTSFTLGYGAGALDFVPIIDYYHFTDTGTSCDVTPRTAAGFLAEEESDIGNYGMGAVADILDDESGGCNGVHGVSPDQ